MTTVAGVPEATVASVALWVAVLIAGAHRLLGARGSTRLGLGLNATLHLLAAGAFAAGLGVGAGAAASPVTFLPLAGLAFVCGHEALTSRLSDRLWHHTGVARTLDRAARTVWLLLSIFGVLLTLEHSRDELEDGDASPLLPPRESRVRRLAFGALGVLALVGATTLLG